MCNKLKRLNMEEKFLFAAADKLQAKTGESGQSKTNTQASPIVQSVEANSSFNLNMKKLLKAAAMCKRSEAANYSLFLVPTLMQTQCN